MARHNKRVTEFNKLTVNLTLIWRTGKLYLWVKLFLTHCVNYATLELPLVCC